MPALKKILYVTSHPEVAGNEAAVKQALYSANALQAELHCLMVHSLAADFRHHQLLNDKLQQSFADAAGAIGVPVVEPAVTLSAGKQVAIEIIRHVISGGFDLVIKSPETEQSTLPGFVSVDMRLMRKCPCPVWLCRPNHDREMRIGVAIDPNYDEVAGRQLSLDLLKLGQQINRLYKHDKLHVLSCWHSDLETSQGNPFLQMDAGQVEKHVEETRKQHHQALMSLLDESSIKPDSVAMHHQKGAPMKLIPRLVKEEAIDLLIMGTVARTGIPGFIIGNTAENILRKLDCSVLAVKPAGFVSPVQP